MTAHPQRGRMRLAQRRRLRAVTAINSDVRPSADRVSYDMLRDGLARNRWDTSSKVLLSCPVPSRYSQVLEKYIRDEPPNQEYIRSVLSVEDEFSMAIAHFEFPLLRSDDPSVQSAGAMHYYLVSIPPIELDARVRAEHSRLACRLPLSSIWRWIP